MIKEKKERKISFNTLIRREYTSHEITPYLQIKELISWMIRLKPLDRHQELKDQKFCFLQAATIEVGQDGNEIIHGFFKSARHKFRPNYLDKQTGAERKSPKKITEGEVEKTHFCIKITEDEVTIILEVNGNGISMTQVANYFNLFAKQYCRLSNLPKNFTISYQIVGKGDFLKELKKLKRARVAEITFDKSLLGSDSLKFSNRLFSLKRNVTLKAIAEKNESIKETAIDLFNRFKAGTISNVRIMGKDDDDTPVILDTSFIEKIESIKSSLNMDTGEIQTTEMLTTLKGFAKLI